MSDFLMPKLGADMTAGKLVAWRKKPGDNVLRGDIMAEVDTDKGVIDIESFSDGVVDALLVEPGTTVPVGTPLARIRAATDSPLQGGPAPTAAPPTVAKLTLVSSANADHLPSLSAGELSRLRISPAARRRAHELGIDPRTITGIGPPGSAITRADIERAAGTRGAHVPPARPSAEASEVVLGAETTNRNLRMRHAIAAAMARANREIPHYYLSTSVDLKSALDWLGKQNEQRSVIDRLLYGVLLLKATALALREVPELNAFWQDDRPVLQTAIHLGIAVSLRGGGLIAPAIHQADQKSLNELMHELRDLVARVRAGGLRSSELTDPTISVTNLGEQGVEVVQGVIYPPQVALVGFGKVVQRPWCADGQVVPRPVITATLAGDHRATDGHRGSVFLATLDRLLQEPEKL